MFALSEPGARGMKRHGRQQKDCRSFRPVGVLAPAPIQKYSNRHPAEAPEDAKEQGWKGSVLYLVTDSQHLFCWYTLECYGVDRRLVASFDSFPTTS
jgi:hypothetical protein